MPSRRDMHWEFDVIAADGRRYKHQWCGSTDILRPTIYWLRTRYPGGEVVCVTIDGQPLDLGPVPLYLRPITQRDV